MYRHSILAGAILAAAVTAVSAAGANAQQFQASLTGLFVVPPNDSNGQGTLKMTLNQQQQSLTYTLTYSSLSSPITASHIHFAPISVNGGVIVFLCSSVGGPAGTPACVGTTSGTVTGMVTGASVIGPVAQGISPGDFAGLANALLSLGANAYASIHTENFPAGEIRSQILQCRSSGC
jgi:hypothetical protein